MLQKTIKMFGVFKLVNFHACWGPFQAFFWGIFSSIWDEGGMQTQNKVKQLFSDGIYCFIIPIKNLNKFFPESSVGS